MLRKILGLNDENKSKGPANGTVMCSHCEWFLEGPVDALLRAWRTHMSQTHPSHLL